MHWSPKPLLLVLITFTLDLSCTQAGKPPKIDPCQRQLFKSTCPGEPGASDTRSQFVLRYYRKGSECVSYPYGHCRKNPEEPELYKYKEECDKNCLNMPSQVIAGPVASGHPQSETTKSSVLSTAEGIGSHPIQTSSIRTGPIAETPQSRSPPIFSRKPQVQEGIAATTTQATDEGSREETDSQQQPSETAQSVASLSPLPAAPHVNEPETTPSQPSELPILKSSESAPQHPELPVATKGAPVSTLQSAAPAVTDALAGGAVTVSNAVQNENGVENDGESDSTQQEGQNESPNSADLSTQGLSTQNQGKASEASTLQQKQTESSANSTQVSQGTVAPTQLPGVANTQSHVVTTQTSAVNGSRQTIIGQPSTSKSKCQQERESAQSHGSTGSPVTIAGAFVPRCTGDGLYDVVQCDERVRNCWCVDEDGVEFPGTRVQGDLSSPPNCSDAYGTFSAFLDETSKQEAKPDVTPEIPLLPQCDVPSDPGTCNTSPTKRWFFDSKEKACKSFLYGGCGGNGNNYESQRECEIQCALPEEPICGRGSEPFVDVNGIQFNCQNKTCPSGYKCTIAGANAVCCPSDDDGSEVGALTNEDDKNSLCNVAKERGPCDKFQLRFYFNQEAGECKYFFYSGCGGNRNNFKDLQECQRICPSKSKSTTGAPNVQIQTDVSSQNPTQSPQSTQQLAAILTNPQEVPTGPHRKTVNVPVSGSVAFQSQSGQLPSQLVAAAENGPDHVIFPPSPAVPIATKAPTIFAPASLFPGQGQAPGAQGASAAPIGGPPSVAPPGGQITFPSAPGSSREIQTLNSILNPVKTAPPPSPSTSSTSAAVTNGVPTGPLTNATQNNTVSVTTAGPTFSFPSQLVKQAEASGVIKPFVRTTKKPPQLQAPELVTLQPPPSFLPGNRCQHPKDAGPCSGRFIRWFWDATKGDCEVFTYGGCQGNGNNFGNREECMTTCHELPIDVCVHPQDPGECSSAFTRWWFDAASSTCKQFVYGGCGGNGNNFASPEECQEKCLKARCPPIKCNQPCIIITRQTGCQQCACPPTNNRTSNKLSVNSNVTSLMQGPVPGQAKVAPGPDVSSNSNVSLLNAQPPSASKPSAVKSPSFGADFGGSPPSAVPQPPGSAVTPSSGIAAPPPLFPYGGASQPSSGSGQPPSQTPQPPSVQPTTGQAGATQPTGQAPAQTPQAPSVQPTTAPATGQTQGPVGSVAPTLSDSGSPPSQQPQAPGSPGSTATTAASGAGYDASAAPTGGQAPAATPQPPSATPPGSQYPGLGATPNAPSAPSGGNSCLSVQCKSDCFPITNQRGCKECLCPLNGKQSSVRNEGSSVVPIGVVALNETSPSSTVQVQETPTSSIGGAASTTGAAAPVAAATTAAVSIGDKCMQPVDPGPCPGPMQQRWWFNKNNRQCEIFEYGGCAGNNNHFYSLKECEIHCARFFPEPSAKQPAGPSGALPAGTTAPISQGQAPAQTPQAPAIQPTQPQPIAPVPTPAPPAQSVQSGQPPAQTPQPPAAQPTQAPIQPPAQAPAEAVAQTPVQTPQPPAAQPTPAPPAAAQPQPGGQAPAATPQPPASAPQLGAGYPAGPPSAQQPSAGTPPVATPPPPASVSQEQPAGPPAAQPQPPAPVPKEQPAPQPPAELKPPSSVPQEQAAQPPAQTPQPPASAPQEQPAGPPSAQPQAPAALPPGVSSPGSESQSAPQQPPAGAAPSQEPKPPSSVLQGQPAGPPSGAEPQAPSALPPGGEAPSSEPKPPSSVPQGQPGGSPPSSQPQAPSALPPGVASPSAQGGGNAYQQPATPPPPAYPSPVPPTQGYGQQPATPPAQYGTPLPPPPTSGYGGQQPATPPPSGYGQSPPPPPAGGYGQPPPPPAGGYGQPASGCAGNSECNIGFEIPRCANNLPAMQYPDGRPILCLPGKDQCPPSSSCYFNGLDFSCCPTSEDPYAKPGYQQANNDDVDESSFGCGGQPGGCGSAGGYGQPPPPPPPSGGYGGQAQQSAQQPASGYGQPPSPPQSPSYGGSAPAAPPAAGYGGKFHRKVRDSPIVPSGYSSPSYSPPSSPRNYQPPSPPSGYQSPAPQPPAYGGGNSIVSGYGPSVPSPPQTPSIFGPPRVPGGLIGQPRQQALYCNQPKDIGPCKGSHLRWYYEQKFGECQLFYYGGCQGNQNNFATQELCQSDCVTSGPSMMCPDGNQPLGGLSNPLPCGSSENSVGCPIGFSCMKTMPICCSSGSASAAPLPDGAPNNTPNPPAQNGGGVSLTIKNTGTGTGTNNSLPVRASLLSNQETIPSAVNVKQVSLKSNPSNSDDRRRSTGKINFQSDPENFENSQFFVPQPRFEPPRPPAALPPGIFVPGFNRELRPQLQGFPPSRRPQQPLANPSGGFAGPPSQEPNMPSQVPQSQRFQGQPVQSNPLPAAGYGPPAVPPPAGGYGSQPPPSPPQSSYGSKPSPSPSYGAPAPAPQQGYVSKSQTLPPSSGYGGQSARQQGYGSANVGTGGGARIFGPPTLSQGGVGAGSGMTCPDGASPIKAAGGQMQECGAGFDGSQLCPKGQYCHIDLETEMRFCCDITSRAGFGDGMDPKAGCGTSGNCGSPGYGSPSGGARIFGPPTIPNAPNINPGAGQNVNLGQQRSGGYGQSNAYPPKPPGILPPGYPPDYLTRGGGNGGQSPPGNFPPNVRPPSSSQAGYGNRQPSSSYDGQGSSSAGSQLSHPGSLSPGVQAPSSQGSANSYGSQSSSYPSQPSSVSTYGNKQPPSSYPGQPSSSAGSQLNPPSSLPPGVQAPSSSQSAGGDYGNKQPSSSYGQGSLSAAGSQLSPPGSLPPGIQAPSSQGPGSSYGSLPSPPSSYPSQPPSSSYSSQPPSSSYPSQQPSSNGSPSKFPSSEYGQPPSRGYPSQNPSSSVYASQPKQAASGYGQQQASKSSAGYGQQNSGGYGQNADGYGQPSIGAPRVFGPPTIPNVPTLSNQQPQAPGGYGGQPSGGCNQGGCMLQGGAFQAQAVLKENLQSLESNDISSLSVNSTKVIADICSLPLSPGDDCSNEDDRPKSNLFYFYSQEDKRCKLFFYKGCGGNENKFASRRECTQRCQKDESS